MKSENTTGSRRFSGRATLKSIADREAERLVAHRHRQLSRLPANNQRHWWD